ncbi:MAG: hypothetical protein DCF15_02755 [Phormidesmis priestleyi]|uniref:Uncharacterized protein n=1 Tax=Phormidesmis priestleyi TaxID=268141 RepID=A0A2W4ZP16_9CYAN|nr:MAG: hypothetical protein DCF15_02755 [Phormidesmis priestleyi]
MIKHFFKPLVWVGIALLLLISVWSRPVTASLTDSRVNQLEYQVRSLQTQVSQLQSRIPGAASSPAPRTEASAGIYDPALDAQFDNLATLVIEINQRVKALESQASGSAR